ncbi:hypothetical protein Sjap_020092 [Stephania japonica]|uniref:Uncharacterized protein n=1 Tax=Stephania japonica TaxID=461633 RepID=A0AAP0HVB6_9MAGN
MELLSPSKKRSPSFYQPNVQMVTIGDDLETLNFGLMELDGSHNGLGDRQWFASPRRYPCQH